MMNNSLIQLHSFSLPKFPSSSSTSGFSSNYNINNRRRRCRFTRFAVSASSVPLLDLPLLPFPKEQILVPSEYKKLHLYEARYLALLEESLYKNNSLFVHFVLHPIAVNETFTEASFAARYACLVSIEKVERLDVGALVFIRGIGRVKLVEFGQEQPFLRGLVMPSKDYVLLDNSELDSKVSELKEALHNLNSLEIKLKAPEEASLQTQTSNALKWAEKTVAVDCDEAFIPSLAERISYSALQPVSGSLQSELSTLQKEKLRAMDIKDTTERIGNSLKYVKNNISIVAAKLALQSLKIQ
ncbi:OLC1v1015855C1 [Oldenlandia corymbosa var. corymbosa]|uniref:OLC1v1015855C1 n=1 Tax=Oldenlandia corymbosa var. corymbosa TaxID=529605 RepID=A0AAV1E685_OLDCO|nr:OLC1v1015855C1 [Oldenlandia corymbosa var. corymbosa]